MSAFKLGCVAAGLALGLITGAERAHAQCAPAAGNNVSATCSGVTTNQGNGAPGTSAGTDGYGTGAETNLSVDVLTGASVTGANDGINAGTLTSLTNSGTITGTTTIGVRATDIANVTNSGIITGNTGGIFTGSLASLTNSGTINTSSVDGIRVTTTLGRLTNSGTITGITNGVSAATITSLTNSGTITSGNAGVNAVNITSLTNSGSITGALNGIFATNTLTSLTNSGTITGGTNGVVAFNTLTSLTNSGTIIGGTFAIRQIGGAGDTVLTLLAGSNLQGRIELGGGVNTLNVGNGLSIANTFDTAAPNIGSTGGAPFAVSGTQVAVVDPTNLAVQDESLTLLTGGISTTLLNRMTRLRGGVSGVTSSGRAVSVGSKGGGAAGGGREYWVQGFGTARNQEGDGPSVDTDLYNAGFVSGMDARYSHRTRAGFFLGGSHGRVSADFNSQDTEADSLFGGAYVSTLRGRLAIDAAVTVGYSDYDRKRRVANNLAAGGIERARADYDGWFLSPEITLTRPFWPMGLRLEKSVTLRYSGQFLDGFSESGAAAPLTVDERDVHVGQARAQLSLPLTREAANGAVSGMRLNGGVELRHQFGDQNVSGALLGQAISFDPGGERKATGGFIGLSGERVSADGFTFQASAEALFEDDGTIQASGKAGVRFRF